MKLFRSLLGRRQFLLGLTGSALTVPFIRLARAFNLVFSGGSARASSPGAIPGKESFKACVAYYSATGSTGKVAGAIYRGIKSVMACDIARIDRLDPGEMDRYDVVALGSPIWYYRETGNLRFFIYHMPRMTGKLCIPFCSHGSQPVGFLWSVSQTILKKGMTIIGWNDWFGGASQVLHMPKPYFTDGHPDDIDLKEAEVFGREMAERAQRIFAGERRLIPEIPSGPDIDPLWVPVHERNATMRRAYSPEGADRAAGEEMAAGPAGNAIPEINMDKCVYPRCTACIDTCPVQAIDLAMRSPGASVSVDPVLIKEACIHCGLCERMCVYDALTYRGLKTQHVIDMNKCTYPRCTLCRDNCPMKSIDFSQLPPVFHTDCEGCDLCWCICPYDAIDIPNLAETHMRLGGEAGSSRADSPFFDMLKEYEAIGRFRPLVKPEDIGWDHLVMNNPHAPRVVLKPENYPYNVETKQ